ncbi:hypothetical protein [Xanthomonas translucens]|uniref:hypothetical protein n=1 Tax=Xanthomonas campestris pv. translucens TaxID=343 RepID=UPI0002A7A088|nr:hypothetical protein FD63_15180 [Xanthomonas translucens pv. undulosa]ELP95595.1 hypothetical protein A989_19378 [Xanthomonas translucens DAR61454]
MATTPGANKAMASALRPSGSTANCSAVITVRLSTLATLPANRLMFSRVSTTWPSRLSATV